jgi:hypothetical protein
MIDFGSKEYLEKLIAHAEGYASAYCKPRNFTPMYAEQTAWLAVRAGYIQAGQDLHDAVIGRIKELEALVEAKDECLQGVDSFFEYVREQYAPSGGATAHYVVKKALALTPEFLKQKIAAREDLINALDRHCEQLEREGSADWDEIDQARDRLKRVLKG